MKPQWTGNDSKDMSKNATKSYVLAVLNTQYQIRLQRKHLNHVPIKNQPMIMIKCLAQIVHVHVTTEKL